MTLRFVWLAVVLAGCACPTPAPVAAQPVAPAPTEAPSVAPPNEADERTAIARLIDAWHDAAARADEAAYFGAMSDGSVFLGTDATERWDKAAFQTYAHPHFAKGKAWSFRSSRRDLIFGDRGDIAWFDEDLVTPNLGPARGSGVVVKHDGRWLIAHYNLTITVPNDRFKEVKTLLESPAGSVAEEE
jgi:SnoaL-like domain